MTSHRMALTCFVLVVAASIVDAQPLPSPTPIDAWGPSGTVRAVARSGDTLYVGGDFDYVGPATGPLAVFDAASAALTPAPVLPGTVDVVAPLADGGWIVTGFFSFQSGARRVLRLHASGAVDPGFFVDPNSPVYAVATAPGVVFLGGYFSTVNGSPRAGVAAVDAATGAVLPWQANLTAGVFPEVRLLLAHQGTLFMAGAFTGAQGSPAEGFAALDVTTAARRTIDPTGLTEVSAMAASGDTVHLVGRTATFPSPLQGGARVALGSGQVTPWPVPDGIYPIEQLAATSTRVVAATSSRVVALDPVSGVAVGPPIVETLVDAIALDGSVLYVASQAFGQGISYRLQSFDANTGAPRAWETSFDSPVRTLAATATRVAAGGFFTSAGGVRRTDLYALNLRTGRPTAFAPSIQGEINALATVGDFLVVGGGFMYLDGQSRPGLVAFTPGGQALPWSPMREGRVQSLLVQGRSLYVAGEFQVMGGLSRPNLAEIDLGTGGVSTWLPVPDRRVRALAATGTHLLAAGEFSTLAAAGRRGGAALPFGGVVPAPWDPGADGPVAAVAAAAGRIAIAGQFSTLQGQPAASGFGVFDGATGALLAFPPPLGGFRSHAAVAALGDQLTVGGAGVAIVSATTGADLGWQPVLGLAGSTAIVQVLARYPDVLVVGGQFLTAGGRAIQNLAIFPSAGPPAPRRLRVRVTGATVALGWDSPAGVTPQVYVLEVTLNGAPLGSFPLAATGVTAAVTPGAYVVRVRAVVDGVPGQLSAPMAFSIPGPAVAPPAPTGLTGSGSGGVVTLAWSAGAGAGTVESYVIEAGLSPGLSNLGVLDTGVVDTAFVSPAPPGRYYVRVRARNASGLSAPSNEVVVTIP